jgi:hypothetical protein
LKQLLSPLQEALAPRITGDQKKGSIDPLEPAPTGSSEIDPFLPPLSPEDSNDKPAGPLPPIPKELGTIGYVCASQRRVHFPLAPPAHEFPVSGYVRLPQILGNPKAKPPIPGVFPVSKSTWWNGVRSGIYPAPRKLSARVTAWRVEDIRALIESL